MESRITSESVLDFSTTTDYFTNRYMSTGSYRSAPNSLQSLRYRYRVAFRAIAPVPPRSTASSTRSRSKPLNGYASLDKWGNAADMAKGAISLDEKLACAYLTLG